MSLGDILRNLVRGARPGRDTHTRLRSGLSITARVLGSGTPCLALTRTLEVGPGRKEAETCARHIGWAGARIAQTTTSKGKVCYVIAPARPEERLL